MIPAPKGEGEETAVPPNSTPIAPCPVDELYVVVSLGTVRRVRMMSGYSMQRFHAVNELHTGEVGHPVRVTISRQDDGIVDAVVVQEVE